MHIDILMGNVLQMSASLWNLNRKIHGNFVHVKYIFLKNFIENTNLSYSNSFGKAYESNKLDRITIYNVQCCYLDVIYKYWILQY
jgi:hypothetical protein